MKKYKLIEKRKTIFSPCRNYRYVLWREFDFTNPTYAMFIGLNPSTADETKDDPTIRRCVGFAKTWGLGALCMTNLFAYRATSPIKMKEYPYPIGPHNDKWLSELAIDASIIIAAWGTNGKHNNRAKRIIEMIPNLKCLDFTKDGSPKHPLYIWAGQKPVKFN